MNGELNANGVIVGGMVGQRGAPGADAKINGYNTLTITGGTNISILQSDDTLTIENTYNDDDIVQDITDLQNNKANTSDLADVATSGAYADLTGIPTNLSDFTNDEGFIDNTVSNLTNYTLATGTGHSIELAINTSTYVMTLNLKNEAGTTISTDSIDLPLESVVVSGSYDSVNKKIVLTLKDGSTVDIPVGDLVSGLQTEITSSNKLNSDYVDDTGHTNKFVTSSDISTWNGKQDALVSGTNIKTINSTTILGSGNFALESLSNKVTSISGSSTNDQYPSAKLTYDQLALKENLSNKVTSISNTSTDTQYPSAKCVYDSQALQDTAITNLDTKVDNEVASLQTELDKYKMLENALPKVTGTGENLNLDKTAKCPMKVGLKGQIQQASTSISGGDEYDSPSPDHPQDIHVVSGDNLIEICGKNLFDKDSEDVGYVYSSNGSYSVSALWNTSDWIAVESNTQYSLSFKTTGTANLFFSEFNKNKEFIQRTTTGSLTPQSNTKYVRLSYRNDLGTYDIQLEKGSTSSEYEAYTGQDYSINLPVENKFNPIETKNAYPDTTVGNTITYNNSTASISYVNCAYLEANKTYTISWEKNTPASISQRNGCLVNSNNIILEQIETWNNNQTTKTITPTNSGYLVLCVDKNSTNIQIEEGTKANHYTPYGTTPIELCKISTYEDEFFKNTIDSEYYDNTLELDKWYLKKRIGKKVLDGSENWVHSTGWSKTNTNVYYCSPVSNTYYPSESNAYWLTDYFIGCTRNYLYANDVDGFSFSGLVGNLTAPFTIRINKTTASDVTNFKTWLSTHNTTVYYVLATPTNTLLNDTLQETLDSFYSYQEQTNISQDNNDMPFVIKASAIYDLTDLVTRVATLETE